MKACVKLIDFAISIKQKSGLSSMFSFGKKAVQGTRSYMSPEQIRNQNLDPRADVYSFGCSVFELLTGKPPFTGTNADELLNKHLTAPIPSVQVYNDNVTPEFANVVKKMMAKRREDRPADVRFFAGVSQDEGLQDPAKAAEAGRPERPPQRLHLRLLPAERIRETRRPANEHGYRTTTPSAASAATAAPDSISARRSWSLRRSGGAWSKRPTARCSKKSSCGNSAANGPSRRGKFTPT